MRVEHRLTMSARCPMNDLRDTYEVVFLVTELVPVEKILHICAGFLDNRIYQEDLTQALANIFHCEVETIGIHSGVKTTVVCRWDGKNDAVGQPKS